MSTQSKKTEKKSSKFNFKTIKTFEDACKKLGIEPVEAEIKAIHTEAVKPMKAYYQLVIIFLAINNGWKPDWGNSSQYKYYPWYWVLSSGFGFSGTLFSYGRTATRVGSRLCTDTSEKALYIAEQFKAEYQDYLLYSE